MRAKTSTKQRPRTKDARKLYREIVKAGHAVTMTARGHMRVVGPAGIAILCSSFDGPNARRGALADLKRAGIDLTAG